MPLQYMLTSEATSRIYRYAGREDSGAKDLLGTPLGQIVGSINTVRAVRDVIVSMVEEFAESASRIASLSG